MKTALRSFALLMLTMVLACSGANPSTSNPQQRNLLSREEITGSGLTNLHEAIQRLRPQFLRGRGSSGISSNFDAECRCYRPDVPEVYMDRARLGTLDVLKSINVEQVRQVQFITGPDTNFQFGLNHPGGVIHIITRS